MNQLAPILKKARQALDLTQEDVAKRLGISQRAYAFYEDENLERMPRAKRIKELGKVLNIPVRTLMQHFNAEIEGESSTHVQEKPVAESQSIKASDTLLTGAHVTLQDYINELKDSRDRWYSIVNSILGHIEKDTKAVLAHQKAWIEYEAEKASGGNDDLKGEIMNKMGKLARGYLLSRASDHNLGDNDNEGTN